MVFGEPMPERVGDEEAVGTCSGLRRVFQAFISRVMFIIHVDYLHGGTALVRAKAHFKLQFFGGS
jgi:hypothetical protein